MMGMDIERLLRLTADYHNFCENPAAEREGSQAADELSLEELDFVAAAAGTPTEVSEKTETMVIRPSLPG